MSSDAPLHDPLSPSLRTLLALFDEGLREVRFPDVDREVLHALAADVEARQCEVEAAEATLAAARAELEAERERLVARAQRALAYARIFAAEDPELSAQLAGLVLAGPAPVTTAAPGPDAPRKRGRPRKQDTLFAAERVEPAGPVEAVETPEPIAAE